MGINIWVNPFSSHVTVVSVQGKVIQIYSWMDSMKVLLYYDCNLHNSLEVNITIGSFMVKEIQDNEVKWIKNGYVRHTVGVQSQGTIPSL